VPHRRSTPPPSIYTKEYYTSMCFGHNEFGRGELASTFRRALEYIQPGTGQRILDMGCGRGEMARACHIAGADVVGMDYSKDATSLAKDFVGVGRVLQASGTHLPFPSDSFDWVIMLQFVEHLSEDDMASCLNETRRVLRPKGKLLILTDNPWHDFYEALRRTYRWLRYHEDLKAPSSSEEMYHVNVRSPIYWVRFLKARGFKNVHAWFTVTPSDAWWKNIVRRMLFFCTIDTWYIAEKTS